MTRPLAGLSGNASGATEGPEGTVRGWYGVQWRVCRNEKTPTQLWGTLELRLFGVRSVE